MMLLIWNKWIEWVKLKKKDLKWKTIRYYVIFYCGRYNIFTYTIFFCPWKVWCGPNKQKIERESKKLKEYTFNFSFSIHYHKKIYLNSQGQGHEFPMTAVTRIFVIMENLQYQFWICSSLLISMDKEKTH